MTQFPKPVPRILYLEDSEFDRELAARALRNSGLVCELSFAADGDEFARALETQTYDLVLCDFNIPSFSGVAALDMVKARCPQVPFIYLSGTIGEERAVESLRQGATDYVLKDKPERLAPVVRRALEESEMRQFHERSERQLAAFSMLGKKLSATKTAREAAQIIVQVADELIGWDACACDLYSAAEDRLTHILNVDTIDSRRVDDRTAELVTKPGELAREVIVQGGKLILKSYEGEPVTGTTPFGNVSRPSVSIIYVPIREGAKVIGLLSIHSYRLNAYDAKDLEVLQALADHCAGALERIRAQMIEAEANALLEKAQEVAQLGSWVSDLGDGTLQWSMQVFRIFGVPKGCAPRTREEFFSLVYPADGERVKEASQAALNEGMPYDLDHRIVRPDGAVRWVHQKATVIRDALGTPTRMLGVVQDITERKELEAQLRQAQKMEAVGQLAGGVAHDFNNLLAVVQGNAELALLEAEKLSPATREYLQAIPVAAEKAANLTRQLLTFSRKQVLQPQPVKLNDVVTNTTKMLRRLISENIELVCSNDPRQPNVHADVGMIEQVVVNLAVNARDAMPQGGRLSISTGVVYLRPSDLRLHSERREGLFVWLKVSDTGTGIAAEHLGHIFEPFFTTKSVGKGSGLGLATVYGILKQHGGWVEVSTEPGKGTTFVVFLPAHTMGGQAKSTRKKQEEVRGGTETILLVEDEPAVRAITMRVLEGYGYKVLEAGSAKEANVQWARHKQEISLLLTDIIMPEAVTGRELAERLKTERPGLKVIFMSGYSAEAADPGTDFLKKNRSRFLQKPCPTRQLLEAIRSALDEQDSLFAEFGL
jgi:PAS domain S-box-containing protein